MSSRDSSIKDRAARPGDVSLHGRRILIVEDSPVVAPFTADVVDELGCTVVGPAPNMAAARQLLEEERFDAAIMDIHIRGERVFPLLEVLEARQIPFVLSSGYADWAMPDKWQDRPRLQKPYTIDQVEAALKSLLASG